jgi:hypothetical protein
MISLLKSFVRLITFHTVLVTGLAVGSTLMCFYLDLTTDMPISLLAAAIIFPISFGYTPAPLPLCGPPNNAVRAHTTRSGSTMRSRGENAVSLPWPRSSPPPSPFISATGMPHACGYVVCRVCRACRVLG